MTGTTRKREPSFRSLSNGQTEMHPRLQPGRAAAVVAAIRVRDDGPFARSRNQRVRDQMRERNLLVASGRPQAAVELFAACVERVNGDAAEARGRRNREALLHVARKRGCRPAQRDELRIGGDRRQRSLRRSRLPASLICLLDDVGAQDQSVRPRSAHAAQIDVQALRHSPRGLIGDSLTCLHRVGWRGRRRFGGRSRTRRSVAGAARPRGRSVTLRGIDLREVGPNRDRLSLAGGDLRYDSGDGRRHLDVNFVGGDLDERIALRDEIADVAEPLDDRAFGDGLAHLGKGYGNESIFQGRLHLIFSRAGGLRLRALDLPGGEQA